MKVCKTCGIEKEIDEFCKDSKTTDGYFYKCKECQSIHYKKYYEENKEKEKIRYKKYYEENKEKESIRQKKYYEENKEKKSIRQKKYYEENKEKIKKYNKNYNEEHKAEKKEYQKKYSKTLKGREVIRFRRHKKRIAYENTDITVEWLIQQKKENEFCELCGTKMNNTNYHSAQAHLDHIIPLNIGGKHIMENVRFICAKCNQSRPKDGRDVIVDKNKLFEIFEDDTIDSQIVRDILEEDLG